MLRADIYDIVRPRIATGIKQNDLDRHKRIYCVYDYNINYERV